MLDTAGSVCKLISAADTLIRSFENGMSVEYKVYSL